ncbi:MBL fold metallo-hydrolase [bacterium]|nr:MBL fold metallo-hydrolase [bacterium]
MKYAKFTVNPFQENTYILYDDSKECIIIDPGCYQAHEIAKLENFINDEGLNPKMVLNTHCHIDHVLAVSHFKAKYNIPFVAHKKEDFNLERLPFQSNLFGMPLKDSVPEVDQYVDEANSIRFGHTELSIRFVPGHSPGHLVFYHRASALLVAGDVLFYESIGRTDLPGCNTQDLLNGIKNKLFTLPESTEVLCGHGPNTRIGHEKKNNPYLKQI